jgi:hypothetical protein
VKKGEEVAAVVGENSRQEENTVVGCEVVLA